MSSLPLDLLELEILDRVDQGVLICDPSARIVYCNPAALSAMGSVGAALPSASIGHLLWSVLPEESALLQSIFHAVVADGTPRVVTWPSGQLDGEATLRLAAKIFPISSGVCFTFQPAAPTPPSHRHRDVDRSELFETLPAAVSVHHGPGHVLAFGNTQFQSEIGARHLEGASANTIWTAPSQAFVLAELDMVYRSGEPVLRSAVPMPRRLNADEFEERYVTYSLTPLRDDGGSHIVGVLRFAIDVTEEVLDCIAVEELSGELAIQAERHRLVNRATNDILWDWDLGTGRIEWSDALTSHFGYDAASVTPTIEWRLAHIHPDDRERVAGSLAHALAADASTWSAEYRFVRHDGTIADVLDRGFVIRNQCGSAERFVGSIVDLSVRKSLERALLESEARLRSSLAAANIGTWRVDLKTGVDMRDGTLNAIFGLGASETVSPIEDFIERVYAEDRVSVVSAIDSAVRHRGEYAIDFRIVRPDGTLRWVRDVGRVLHDEHGPFAMTGAVVDVTDSRRAEEAIRASEVRYRSLVLATNHLVWTADAEGRMFGTQPLWCAFTGQKLDAALGDGWLDAIHPDDRARTHAAWTHSVARQRVHQAECRIRRDDGTYRTMMVRAAPVLDGHGAVREWIATAVDVSESRTIEAQIAAVFDGAPIGIAVLDRQLRVLRVNQKMLNLEQLTWGDSPGASAPHLRERLGGYHQRVLRTGEAIMGIELSAPAASFSGIGPAPDGHFLLGFYPVRVGSDVQGTVCIALDITARKRVEESFAHLARSSRELSSSLDLEATSANAAAAFVPHQADFAAVFLSPTASITLGAHEHPRRLGTTAAALVHVSSERRPSLSRALEDARIDTCAVVTTVMQEKTTCVFERIDEATLRGLVSNADAVESLSALHLSRLVVLPLLVQDEAIGVVLLGRHHTAGDGAGHPIDIPLVEEMTRRAAVAIQNARLFELARSEQVRVEEANRAKDEFLAVVSHELRTPLNAVLGWAKMLRSGTLPDDQVRRAIETIERNARAQAQLIEDLLDISRIITGKLRIKLESLDLARIVEAAVDVVRPAATAKGVSLVSEVVDMAAPLVGDGDRLQQVLWNLLSNAVKFTPTGGKVVTRLARNKSSCVVTVEDSGQGIAREFLPHIFDRFRQADGGTTRPHGGLGLGLAIVKHIAELHGGAVEAMSDGLGRGSRFTLTLPIAPRDVSLPLPFERLQEPAPPSTRPLPPRPQLGGLRVLVVDDEPDARDLMESILAGAGARVRTASSVEEAFAELEREPCDIVVSDIAMPVEDGYALITRLRALAPEDGGRLPTIALTAYARNEDKKRALAAGFTCHMTKPVEPHSLLSTLARLTNLGS